jgi:predicted Rossmann fold flavoprotein
MEQFDVVIIGSGPAGLMAGCRAALRGRRTLVLEKNRRAGVKILLSGGTRCNLTHATDCRGIVAAFGPSGRFLHSALAALGPQQLLDLFDAEGVPTKTEANGKVFPASDRAADVLDALLRRLDSSGCTLALEEPLHDIQPHEDGFQLITAARTILAEKVILATGGQSYPQCGTTGDGYRWAAALGHTIVEPRTALVPITTHAGWVTALQGITIPDAAVKVVESDGTYLAEQRGAVLFAHFGLTGPAILDVSRAVSRHSSPTTLLLQCDFLPEINQQELAQMLQQECQAAPRKQLSVILARWIPHRLAESLVEIAQLSPDLRAAELSKRQRQDLVTMVKRQPIPVAGTMGFRKAEVTSGGVSLDEVDSRTMESRLVKNLLFAGELLDLDGPIGGYNFHAAFSTGWLAGENA